MCLARIRFVGEDKKQTPDVIEDVAHIELTPQGVLATDLVGSVTRLQGKIQRIDFMESVVTFENKAQSPNR